VSSAYRERHFLTLNEGSLLDLPFLANSDLFLFCIHRGFGDATITYVVRLTTDACYVLSPTIDVHRRIQFEYHKRAFRGNV
jgi:hypothetical protein